MIPNPSQLTAELRMMPDRQLLQFAQLHKNDPYIFPMVVAEDTARKQIRAQAQAAMYRPQPTVADQAMMGMAQQPQAPGLSALRAPNLEGMSDGGIAGYADGGEVMEPGMLNFAQHSEPVVRMAGGTNPLQQYSSLIRSEAENLGIDPSMAMRLFMTESGGNPEAKSKKGAVGLGQLMPEAAAEMGLSPDERTDPVKNIKASLAYFAKQQRKFGDSQIAAAAYNWGPDNVEKHLKKNEGKLNIPGLPRETAKYITSLLPMGTAQAEEKTPTVSTGEIPRGAPGTYPTVLRKEPEEGFFGRIGTRMGMSAETKRNIENLNNALAGALGPAYIPGYVGKAPGLISGIASLGERIYGALSPAARAERQAQAALQEMSAARAAQSQAQAVQQAAEAAQMSGALPGEVRTATQSVEAAQAAQAAARAAQVPSAAEKIQAASIAREAQMAGRIPQAARVTQTATQATALPTMMAAANAARVSPGENYSNEGRTYIPKPTKEDVPEIKKEAPPEIKQQAKKEGWTNDDWLTFGFGLLSSRSPYFSEALGTAGLGALKGKQEREKMALEKEKAESEKTYKEALGRQATATASLYEEQKGPAMAMQMANQAFANWEKNQPTISKLDANWAATSEAVRKQYLVEAFKYLGLSVPSELTSGAAGAMPAIPQGVKVRQLGG